MFAQTTGKRARVTGFACADGLHGISVTVMRVVGEQCSPLRWGLYQSLECVIENVCQYHLTWWHSLEYGAPRSSTLRWGLWIWFICLAWIVIITVGRDTPGWLLLPFGQFTFCPHPAVCQRILPCEMVRQSLWITYAGVVKFAFRFTRRGEGTPPYGNILFVSPFCNLRFGLHGRAMRAPTVGIELQVGLSWCRGHIIVGARIARPNPTATDDKIPWAICHCTNSQPTIHIDKSQKTSKKFSRPKKAAKTPILTLRKRLSERYS